MAFLSISLDYLVQSRGNVVGTLVSVLRIAKYSQLLFCLFNRIL